MEKYETTTITESEAKKHGFPAKAIGYWAIVEESEEHKILHRLNKDGRFGSDRPNNILKIQNEKIADFLKSKTPNDERLLTAKASNGETVVIARTHTVDLTADDEPKIEKPEPNIKMDETEEIESWKNSNIGTRKTRWIEQLLTQMKSEPFTLNLIEKIGEVKFVELVLKDTASDRMGGKAYSSIDSAMRVWNGRISRGEF